MSTTRAQALHQPAQDSHAVAVFQSGRPVRSTAGEQPVTSGEPVRAHIHVPIISGQSIIGVLAVYSQQEQSFEESDQFGLTTLADYAAIALEKIRAMAELRSQIELASQAGRTALLHAETLFDPVDGIEAQVDTLLAGGFGPLTEEQHSAVGRIRQATIRLKEVVGFIREAMAGA
jgi:GAF domain-containing protein